MSFTNVSAIVGSLTTAIVRLTEARELAAREDAGVKEAARALAKIADAATPLEKAKLALLTAEDMLDED